MKLFEFEYDLTGISDLEFRTPNEYERLNTILDNSGLETKVIANDLDSAMLKVNGVLSLLDGKASITRIQDLGPVMQ